MTYTVREELKPSGLKGISDEQINDHWNLYKGYVTQSNALKEQLEAMRQNGQGGTPEYMDRRRRFGFEFNGMVLHEYYFGNLEAGISANQESSFYKAVTEKFGSFEAWQEDLANAGKTRSVGWAICYMDPQTGDINNHFVQLHEDGNIAGYHPMVVLDVFEHAYMVDHKAGGRPDYINNFFENVNWNVVEKRFLEASSKETSKRFAA